MADIINISTAGQITAALAAFRDSMPVTQPSGGTQGTLVIDVGYTIATHTAGSTLFQGIGRNRLTGEREYYFTLVDGATKWVESVAQRNIKNLGWEAKDTVGVGIVTGAVSAGSGFIEAANVTLTKGAYSATTTSAATTGIYTFTGVPATTGYTVAAAKTGYAPGQATINVTENTTTTQNLTIVEYGTIEGTCKNDNGDDLDDATVTITKGSVTETTTSAAGAYEIIDLPVDTGYTLTVAKANHVTGSYTVNITEAAATTQNVVASRYGSISGTVTDEDGNVSGLTVEVCAVDTETPILYTATTIANGTYAIASVAPGTYDIWFRKTNYVSAKNDDQVVAAATDKVSDELMVQYANYGGDITDGDSNPLAGADVAFYTVYPGTAAYVTTSAETTGAWAITNIEPGTYQFRVSKTGYTPKFIADFAVAGNEDIATSDHQIVAIP
jgi:hypothetical protein